MDSFSTTDQYWMQLAIQEARRGTATWLNPRVGAVVVKDNHCLARGAHLVFGQAHAERNALSQLTDAQLKGATLYVTLEPCSHQGKQPPCADLVATSGIKRVVIASKDPHPVVTGHGIAKLKAANVDVEVGCCHAAATNLNAAYFFYFKHQRPEITLKQATSLDGKVGLRGARTQLTSPATSELTHAKRGAYQAILVGAQTVLVDDPALTPLPARRFNPIRVVMDRRGRTLVKPDLKVFAGPAPTIVYTQPGARVDDRVRQKDGVTLVYQDRVSPTSVVQDLAKRGIQSLLVEGGPTVEAAFYAAGLWDRLVTYQTPVVVGSNGVAALARVPQPTRLGAVTVRKINHDVEIEGRNPNVYRLN